LYLQINKTLRVDDLCIRGESILQRYRTDVARQKDEITKLKHELKAKDEEITRLNEPVAGNDACKNCDELRTALEEFQEAIEKDLDLEGFKNIIAEKEKLVVESKESLEEVKLKLATSRNENFTLKKLIRELKRHAEAELDGKSPAFPKVYLGSCREALQVALDSVTKADTSNSGLETLRTSTATLCGFFDQLLEHCSSCSQHDPDSGIDESDSEKKMATVPQVCDDCQKLKDRYSSLCEVNNTLVDALIKYEDMTLLLKITSQNELLWGPAFKRVMKMITDLNSPSCTEKFSRTWAAKIAPQLEKLKTKVGERAHHAWERSATVGL
jgi:hypothetical protein